MPSELTLGSLFDGSGGFPLGGLLCGIRPVWASEVEPFPIRVTTKRLPQMRHLGDVKSIDGAQVEPVDVITFGSPCTDMSVAGKRAGLDGSQSVLFYEAIRIVREMRKATNGASPRYIVWENVPGAISSNGGRDFKAVLDAIVQTACPETEVPAPPDFKWPHADILLGNGWSVAYRIVDAQYFGVAQRRRRIYLVADFGSECAGEVLFEREGVSRDYSTRFKPREATAGDVGTCVAGESVPWVLNERQIALTVAENAASTLIGTDYKGPQCVFLPTAYGISSDGSNGMRSENPLVGIYEAATARTLDANGGNPGCNQGGIAVVGPVLVEMTSTKNTVCEDGISPTLTARMGTGGNQVNCVAGFKYGNSADARGIGYEEEKSPTLAGTAGGNQTPVICLRSGALETMAFAQNQRNEVRDLHDRAGALAAEPGAKQQTYVLQGSMIGRDDRNGPQGDGVSEGICYTLNTLDRHAVALDCRNFSENDELSATLQAKNNGGHSDNYVNPVCYAIDRAAFNQGANAQFQIGIAEEQAQTLVAKGAGAVAQPASFYPQMKAESQCFRRDGKSNTLVNGTNPGYQNGLVETSYCVRRLTPTECARLQGFPDWWCADLGTSAPTDAEVQWWTDVFETHRRILGTSGKPKSRTQIIKWLEAPHSDAAEYKMWGNGVALPCVVFVLLGIAENSCRSYKN